MNSSSATFVLPETPIKEPVQLFDRIIIALNAYLSAHKSALINPATKRNENIKSIAKSVYRYFGMSDQWIDDTTKHILSSENLKQDSHDMFVLRGSMPNAIEPDAHTAVRIFKQTCDDIRNVFTNSYVTGFTIYGYNPIATGSSVLKQSVEAALSDADNVVRWLEKEAEKEQAYLLLYCSEVEAHKVTDVDFDMLLNKIAECIKQVAPNGCKTYYINDVGYIGRLGKSYDEVLALFRQDQLNDPARFAFGISLNLSGQTLRSLMIQENSTKIKDAKILKSVSQIEVWNSVNHGVDIRPDQAIVKHVAFDSGKLVVKTTVDVQPEAEKHIDLPSDKSLGL